MSITPSYRAYVLDQVRQVVPITSRPMFGGLTLFAEGLAFALLAGDRLYFKVDDLNRAEYETKGRGPFYPFGDTNKPMSYYELPEEALEDVDELRPWVEGAIQVARRKARPKRKKGC